MTYYGEPIDSRNGDVIATSVGNKSYSMDALDEWNKGFIMGLNEAREMIEREFSEWSSVETDNRASALDKLRAELVSEAMEHLHYGMTRKTVQCIVELNEDKMDWS